MAHPIFGDLAEPRYRFTPRIQDLLLALVFGALIYLAHTPSERWLMGGIAVLQLIEGHFSAA